MFLNPKKSQNSATDIPEDFLLAQVVVWKSFIKIKGDNQHLLSHLVMLTHITVFIKN